MINFNLVETINFLFIKNNDYLSDDLTSECTNIFYVHVQWPLLHDIAPNLISYKLLRKDILKVNIYIYIYLYKYELKFF